MAKILILISGYSRFGGTFVKVKKLIEKSSHDYVIYFPLFKKDKAIYEENKNWLLSYKDVNVKVYEGFHDRNLISHILRIHRIIKSEKIEIVHAYFNFETVIAKLYKSLVSPKTIVIRAIEGYECKKLSNIKKYVLSKSFLSVNKFVYVSKYLKKQYESDFPVLKKKDNVIIYNSPINVSEIRTQYSQRQNLVCTAGFTERKNLKILIESMNIVINTYKRPFLLELVGDGELRDEFEKMISNYSLHENVKLVGFTSDVSGHLNNCAIYLHSAITEGFGIAVAEAMQMGCPIIASDAGALPELVDDGVTGYIVDAYDAKIWADKICELMDNIELRKKMSVAAIERVERLYNETSYIEKHNMLYDELAKNQI